MPGKPRRRKKGGQPSIEVTVVKDLQRMFRADVLEACGTLDAKLSIVQDRQCELLATIENITKFTEVIQTTAKELEDKVSKVNKATDKIASTTTSYRDALLSKPANSNRANTDLEYSQTYSRPESKAGDVGLRRGRSEGGKQQKPH
jgi:hypothetical protein